MTGVNYPGASISQSFDAAGRLTSIYPTGSSSLPYYTATNYLPSGTVSYAVYGNSMTETLSENSRLQPCEHRAFLPAPIGGTMVLDKQYFYASSPEALCGAVAGNNGNIFHIGDGTNPVQGSGNYTENFAYDSLNRLTHFDTALMGSQARGQDFSYNSFGNMLAMSSIVPTVPNTPDPLAFAATNQTGNNRLASSTFKCLPLSAGITPQGTPGQVDVYDAAGNIGCSGTQGSDAEAFLWDAANRISQVWKQQNNNTYAITSAYTYGADGARIRSDQAADSTGAPSFREYVNFGGLVLAEKDQTGSWASYVYANGKKIVRIDQKKPLLHLQGIRDNTTINGYGAEGTLANVPTGSLPLTIRTGDRLVMDMKQTINNGNGATYGGVALFHNWPGAADFNDTLNATDDATGVPLFANSLEDGQWHHLSSDLVSAGYEGMLVTSVEAGIHNGTPLGQWDVYLANIAILRADGSVVQLYAGQSSSVASVSGWGAGGSHSMTSATESTATGGDPQIANTYYLADPLGTTQFEFNSGGWPTWRGEFAPFGQELDGELTANHYKFTGKERDAESGLDYFGARYYASSMGRWMSPDWADKPEAVPYSDLANPQSLNLYGYVNNNPLSHSDPDGHCCWDYITGAIGEALNVVPDTANLGVSAFNAVSGRMGGPQMDSLQRIEPDNNHDSIAGARAVSIVTTVIAAAAPIVAPMMAPEAGTAASEEGAAGRAGTPSTPSVPESIPAGPSARPTGAQQGAINEMGEAHGCHTCGTSSPGTKSGNWVGDHQPPTKQNPTGGPQVYKPQCLQCSRRQGGEVAAANRTAKKANQPQQ